MPDGLIVDLFAGVGWSVGLRQLGISDIGIELDRWACATRTAAGFTTIRADVAMYPTALRQLSRCREDLRVADRKVDELVDRLGQAR